MTISELKACLKLIGFEYGSVYFNAYANGDYILTIYKDRKAIRLDNYAEDRSLFMSLSNKDFMERLINFVEYEVLILKKNK